MSNPLFRPTLWLGLAVALSLAGCHKPAPANEGSVWLKSSDPTSQPPERYYSGHDIATIYPFRRGPVVDEDAIQQRLLASKELLDGVVAHNKNLDLVCCKGLGQFLVIGDLKSPGSDYWIQVVGANLGEILAKIQPLLATLNLTGALGERLPQGQGQKASPDRFLLNLGTLAGPDRPVCRVALPAGWFDESERSAAPPTLQSGFYLSKRYKGFFGLSYSTASPRAPKGAEAGQSWQEKLNGNPVTVFKSFGGYLTLISHGTSSPSQQQFAEIAKMLKKQAAHPLPLSPTGDR